MSEIRVNNVINAAGDDAPKFPYGFSVATGYGITGGGNITGTAATFSGAVNVDATTDSTSATTGALIVDGGLGVAKNVYIGAGLSVAGTLTYEDVTSVDSVGLITAKSGVNITGGQLQVGVAYSVGNAGVCTAAGFVGPLTGTLQTAAQTNVTSVGTLAGLTVGSAGEFKVGTAVTISSTAGVTTFSKDVIFAGAAAANYVQWDQSASALHLADNTNLWLGNVGGNGDLRLYHDGSDSYVNSQGTGHLYIRGDDVYIQDAASGHNMGVFVEDGGVDLYYNNGLRFSVLGEGAKVSGMMSATAGIAVTGGMWEGAFIKAGKLTDNKTLGISTSNIFVFTTTETTTGTPNIIWDDTYALGNKMKVGDSVTITVITTAAAAGYCANWTVDGTAVTEQWNGGSAPTAGGADGYDIYTHTLVRKAVATGDSGWLMFSNVNNFT